MATNEFPPGDDKKSVPKADAPFNGVPGLDKFVPKNGNGHPVESAAPAAVATPEAVQTTVQEETPFDSVAFGNSANERIARAGDYVRGEFGVKGLDQEVMAKMRDVRKAMRIADNDYRGATNPAERARLRKQLEDLAAQIDGPLREAAIAAAKKIAPARPPAPTPVARAPRAPKPEAAAFDFAGGMKTVDKAYEQRMMELRDAGVTLADFSGWKAVAERYKKLDEAFRDFGALTAKGKATGTLAKNFAKMQLSFDEALAKVDDAAVKKYIETRSAVAQPKTKKTGAAAHRRSVTHPGVTSRTETASASVDHVTVRPKTPIRAIEEVLNTIPANAPAQAVSPEETHEMLEHAFDAPEETPVASSPELLAPDEARDKLREMLAKYGQTQLESDGRDGPVLPVDAEFLAEPKPEAASPEPSASVESPIPTATPEAVPGTKLSELLPEERAVIRAEAAGLGKEREAMLTAERELLAAEKTHYKEHSLIGRLFRRGDGRAALEDKVNDASAAYEFALKSRMLERMKGKDYAALQERKKAAGILKEGSSPEDFAAKVAARYRRSVVFRDVIERGEKLRIDERVAALSSKDRTVFDKAKGLYASHNAWLVRNLPGGQKTARAVLVLESALLGSGAVALTGPAGAAFGLGALSWRLARGFGMSFGGSAVIGGAGGYVYQKGFGDRAARNLETARSGQFAMTSEDVARMRQAYQGGTAEAIARKRRTVELLTPALLGAGVSVGIEAANILSSYEVAQRATETLADSAQQPAVPMTGMMYTATPLHGGTFGPPPLEASRLGTVDLDQMSRGAGLEVPHASGAAAAMPAAPEAPHYPQLSVNASPGHGYEWMVKRMWEQLQQPGNTFDAHAVTPGSDVDKLLKATPTDIDKVVHEIASDPRHPFFRADGSSVRIDPSARLALGSDGQLTLSGGGAAQASEHAPAMPPPSAAKLAPLEHRVVPPRPEPHPAIEQPAPTARAGQVYQQGSKTTAQLNALEAERVRPTTHAEAPPPPPPKPEVPHAAAPAAPEAPLVRIEHASEFVNRLNVHIDPTHAHIFADNRGAMLAYGNNYEERFSLAQVYAQAHHEAVVWVQAEKPVFYQGAWRPWAFSVRYGGILQGIRLDNAVTPTPDQIGAVSPDTFIKQLQ